MLLYLQIFSTWSVAVLIILHLIGNINIVFFPFCIFYLLIILTLGCHIVICSTIVQVLQALLTAVSSTRFRGTLIIVFLFLFSEEWCQISNHLMVQIWVVKDVIIFLLKTLLFLTNMLSILVFIILSFAITTISSIAVTYHVQSSRNLQIYHIQAMKNYH